MLKNENIQVKGEVVHSVQFSIEQVDDYLIDVKISKLELHIPTDEILSSYFILWLVCSNNTDDVFADDFVQMK